MPQPTVAARLRPLIAVGAVATCGIVDLEVLFSARDARELAAVRAERDLAFERIDMTQADFDRAADVLLRLAQIGMHRAVSLPDLLLGAVAERARLTVLHYDKDFDTLAKATGQPTEWVAPAGSLG